MNRFLAFIFLLSIALWSCNKNVNGIQVSGFHPDGITGPNGEKYTVSGFGGDDASVFFLVRHAEKASGADPELTAEGSARAKKLGKILEDVELDGVYSSDFKRTRSTAAPSAELQKKKINLYDHKKLQTLADEVSIGKGKKFLIVGHSNTTPDLLNLFQSEKVYDHIDHEVYDNLYVVIFNKKKKTKILELKY